MARRYLITGGAGFIGSHLTEILLSRGNSVIALDNLSTGSLENLENVCDDPRFRFVHGSVLDELAVDEVVHDVDIVIHLAAAVGVKLIVEQPLRSFTTNIRGSEIVLEAAHRYRRKIMIASTSEIYGKAGGPLTETTDRIIGAPSVARWAYSVAKSVDEILAYAYHKERGLPIVVVRLFNTVGPRQSPSYGMVLPRFVRQALSGEPLTVHGDGTQTRCFCHVYDVTRALADLLEDEAAVGQAFNVGSTEEVAIRDLAELVSKRAGRGSPIEYIPYAQAYEEGFEDMMRRLPDISAINRQIGWEPTYSLIDIIESVLVDTRGTMVHPGVSSTT